MRKLFIILLFLGCKQKTDVIIKECTQSHTVTTMQYQMVGKIQQLVPVTTKICDKREFIYYDEIGTGYRIEFTKKSVWKFAYEDR
jgi:hypothetical protein